MPPFRARATDKLLVQLAEAIGELAAEKAINKYLVERCAQLEKQLDDSPVVWRKNIEADGDIPGGMIYNPYAPTWNEDWEKGRWVKDE